MVCNIGGLIDVEPCRRQSCKNIEKSFHVSTRQFSEAFKAQGSGLSLRF